MSSDHRANNGLMKPTAADSSVVRRFEYGAAAAPPTHRPSLHLPMMMMTIMDLLSFCASEKVVVKWWCSFESERKVKHFWSAFWSPKYETGEARGGGSWCYYE